jgi:hypothetical protein
MAELQIRREQFEHEKRMYEDRVYGNRRHEDRRSWLPSILRPSILMHTRDPPFFFHVQIALFLFVIQPSDTHAQSFCLHELQQVAVENAPFFLFPSSPASPSAVLTMPQYLEDYDHYPSTTAGWWSAVHKVFS